ncbi:MAG: hypothetical protein IKP22_13970 [Clostridia bacterium]|nr:hypothetical protein [Clostridia bacterium]
MSKYMRKLTPSEMELVTDGKRPSAGQGIADLFSWIACGFHHRYALTGKTREDTSRVFPITFYQVKCLDCGHTTWTRFGGYVRGPKVKPDLMPKP